MADETQSTIETEAAPTDGNAPPDAPASDTAQPAAQAGEIEPAAPPDEPAAPAQGQTGSSGDTGVAPQSPEPPPDATTPEPAATDAPDQPADPAADDAAAEVAQGDGVGEPAAGAADDPTSDAPADATPAPEDGEQAVEAVGEPEPSDSAPLTPSPETAPPEPPLPPTDSSPTTEEGAASSADDAPAKPIIAQAIPDTQPIFAGAAHPSPPPDTGDEELLPHPALGGQGPGFIPGTTESTQAFIPVPGEISAAAVAAQAIADAGASSGTDAPPPSDGATGDDVRLADNIAPKDQAGGAAGAAEPAPATPAVPTAAHVPCAFDELNDDASAALDDIDEGEAEVLRLELQGLANLALAILKRLEKVAEKKAVGEQLEGIQSSAERVVEHALGLFTTEEADLAGFQSASAELVLDDLCEDS